jgi:hypothetical protein
MDSPRKGIFAAKKDRIIPHRDNSGRSKRARSRSLKKLHGFIQTAQAYFSRRAKKRSGNNQLLRTVLIISPCLEGAG